MHDFQSRLHMHTAIKYMITVLEMQSLQWISQSNNYIMDCSVQYMQSWLEIVKLIVLYSTD